MTNALEKYQMYRPVAFYAAFALGLALLLGCASQTQGYQGSQQKHRGVIILRKHTG